jgi:ELWxxDGT repeat protein
VLLFLLLALPALAQPAHQVVDLNTTLEDFTSPLFTAQGFAVLGTTVFFVENDGVHGIELWKTDGTPAGTSLFADGITSGCGGGNYCPDQPITRGEMAVFLATVFHLPLP